MAVERVGKAQKEVIAGIITIQAGGPASRWVAEVKVKVRVKVKGRVKVKVKGEAGGEKPEARDLKPEIPDPAVPFFRSQVSGLRFLPVPRPPLTPGPSPD